MPAKKVQSQKRGNEKSSHTDFKDYIIIALASLSVFLLASVIAFYLNFNIEEKIKNEAQTDVQIVEEIPRLRYWSVVLVKWHELGHLRTMDRVFENLQYQFVNASHGDDWDFLWSIEQPFTSGTVDENEAILFAGFNEKTLRKEQKVNHFPSMSSLVSKSFMNQVNSRSPYILPSFVLPYDLDKFNEYLAKNPNIKLVEKNVHNRGVKIMDRKDVLEEKSNVFYQRFMDNHFLIDGYAFDFGVFVLITSFDPIRIYRYDADILLRFCAKKYHPFDPLDVDRYVVRRGCHNAYDMPTFEKTYQNYKYPFKTIFEHHIEKQGFKKDDLWEKIDDAIVSIVMNSEYYVTKSLKERNLSSHHFFDLVRFDFLLDNDLNPYVMEVNMSPNLTPAAKRYEENVLIYEQMIFNVVHMIGAGSYFEFMSRFNDSNTMVANNKNIAVDIDSCLKYECNRNCSLDRCKICYPCASNENRYQMREAFREQMYSSNFRRVFPSKDYYYDDKFINRMSENNQISINWFRAKCEDDKRWC